MWAIRSLGHDEDQGLFAFLLFCQLAALLLFLFPSDCVALRFLVHVSRRFNTWPSSIPLLYSLSNTPTIKCPHLAVLVMHRPPDATTFHGGLHARSVLN